MRTGAQAPHVLTQPVCLWDVFELLFPLTLDLGGLLGITPKGLSVIGSSNEERERSYSNKRTRPGCGPPIREETRSSFGRHA